MLTEIREIRVQKSTCTRIAYWGYWTRIARITRISCLVSKDSRDSCSKINTQYYFLSRTRIARISNYFHPLFALIWAEDFKRLSIYNKEMIPSNKLSTPKIAPSHPKRTLNFEILSPATSMSLAILIWTNVALARLPWKTFSTRSFITFILFIALSVLNAHACSVWLSPRALW